MQVTEINCCRVTQCIPATITCPTDPADSVTPENRYVKEARQPILLGYLGDVPHVFCLLDTGSPVPSSSVTLLTSPQQGGISH